jgi:acyl-coenzyme A thioesterase PaaI-like protein
MNDVSLDGGVVTVAFKSEFSSAEAVGTPVYATGRVVRETKSMAFVQGSWTRTVNQSWRIPR